MADIRINALTTTATSSASDDYIAIDGSANGTRKLSVYSPTFGGNLTVSGSSGLILSSSTPTISSSATNAGINYTANGTGVHGFNNAINVNGVNGVGKLNARAETDGNLHVRAYSLINGSGTGVALDALNDANNALTGFYIRGSAVKLGGPVTMTDNLTVSGTGTSSVAGPFTAPNLTVYDPSNTFAASFRGTGAANTLVAIGTVTGGAAINAYTSTFSATAALLLQPNGGNLLLGTTTDGGQKLQVSGTASISGALSIGNTVTSAVSVASTHKVTISIGGVTYYLLASNV